MEVKKSGKCAKCGLRCFEKRTFLANVDMFNPTAEVKIEGQLSVEIKKFRDDKLFCESHRKVKK